MVFKTTVMVSLIMNLYGIQYSFKILTIGYLLFAAIARLYMAYVITLYGTS